MSRGPDAIYIELPEQLYAAVEHLARMLMMQELNEES
jgi:hypothetical protein